MRGVLRCGFYNNNQRLLCTLVGDFVLTSQWRSEGGGGGGGGGGAYVPGRRDKGGAKIDER